VTSISIAPGDGRPTLDFRGGAIVPRLVGQGPRSARFALVAGGALLLGGDEVVIDVRVGAGCVLELEDVGGTVAYDADDEPSSWAIDIRVAAGGTLIWHGLPLVVSDGAHVVRTTRASLSADAVLCLRDTVVLGRASERGGRLRQRMDVMGPGGRPIFVEDLDAVGGDDVPGVLGDNRILDSMLLAGVRAPQDHDGSRGRILQLELPGSLARYLGKENHGSPIGALWPRWRAHALQRADDTATPEYREHDHVHA
jgi:urease accessory protein